MTTIATFARSQDADLLRARLEAAGIRVFLPDEAVSAWVVAAAPMVGGVRLQVEDTDVPRARELMSALSLQLDPPVQ